MSGIEQIIKLNELSQEGKLHSGRVYRIRISIINYKIIKSVICSNMEGLHMFDCNYDYCFLLSLNYLQGFTKKK